MRSRRSPKLAIYRAKDGFRWRLKGANGKIIAEGGEAYKRRPEHHVLFSRIMDAMNKSLPSVKP